MLQQNRSFHIIFNIKMIFFDILKCNTLECGGHILHVPHNFFL